MRKVNLKNITRMEGDAQPKTSAQVAKAVDGDSIHATPANPKGGEFALPDSVKAKIGLNTPDGEAALKASQGELTAQSDAKSEGFPNGLKE